MAAQSVWYYTDIPEDIVEIIERDISQKFDWQMRESRLYGDEVDKERRNSQNTWIPTDHWLGGFVWHYVQRANRENFQYDLSHLQREALQYARYDKGMFYTWHTDFKKDDEEKLIRKLSFSLQLSSPDDYEGGNVQLLDDEGKSHIFPRKRGSICFFDSRLRHRVRKVKKGTRKSIVGWVAGPSWK